MDKYSLKPDFEMIAFALQFKDSTMQKFKDLMLAEESKTDYSGKKDFNINFESLLQEFHLEDHQSNLHFLIHFFPFMKIYLNRHWDGYSQRKLQEFEIAESLLFLFRFEKSDLTIELKHQQLKLSVPINDEGTIKLFQEFLLKKYIEIQGGTKKEQNNIDLKYWEEKVNLTIDQILHFPNVKKGRGDIHYFTGQYIEILQKYLQKYTDLKADRGTIISRRQSLFIYKLLNLCELIPEGLSYKQDNIRHILRKHLEHNADYQ